MIHGKVQRMARPAGSVAARVRRLRGPRNVALLVLALVCVVAVPLASTSVGRTTPVEGFTRLADNPEPVSATDVEWAVSPVPGGRQILVGLVRAHGAGPLLVMVPGSDGLSTTYVDVAHDLARGYGIDVAFGCWFDVGDRSGPDDPTIACPFGPEPVGVRHESLPSLEGIVDAAVRLEGTNPPPVALMGFSRGGGLVALREVEGGREPWIDMAGLVQPESPLGIFPGEVDVVARVSRRTQPVLILHGEVDGAVAPEQSRRLAAALRSRGTSVEEHYYPGTGHGLMMVPELRADVERRIAAFVHAQLDPLVRPGSISVPATEPAPLAR